MGNWLRSCERIPSDWCFMMTAVVTIAQKAMGIFVVIIVVSSNYRRRSGENGRGASLLGRVMGMRNRWLGRIPSWWGIRIGVHWLLS
jgi:hypothetical protein